MRVPYDESVANRIGPEPCAGAREGAAEASAEDWVGRPLSCARRDDAVEWAEGDTHGRDSASVRMTRRGLRPWYVQTLLVSGSKGRGPRGTRATTHSARAGQENMRNVALARAMVSPSAVISASAKPSVPPALITRGSILSHCPSLAVAT